MKIIIINGPNLNLLGEREEEHYGNQNFKDYFDSLTKLFPLVDLQYFQSNIEGEIINKLHETGFSYDGVILNAGGYSHTSVAIGDAVKAIRSPVVEVHISNIFRREAFRHVSYIGTNACGCIIGFGLKGYQLAIQSLLAG